MKSEPKSIDDYLSALTEDKRSALGKLRKSILAAAPKAVECIAYRLPAFRLDGRLLVAFGAAKHHCSFFPMSAAWIEAHASDLKRYETSKGTIRFPADEPLPATLVKKIVRARIAENGDRAKARRGR